MKKQAWTGLIAATACTLAIGVSAQTTTPTTQQPTSTTAADRITVTGCLQRDSSSATAGATGTSGTTAASSSMAAYVLNVTPAAGAGTTTGSTAGATTAGTSGAKASSYRLDADDSKLSAHVGHKVEITGSLDKSSSTAPSGSTSTAGATSPSASSSMSPKLKVDSVRMIAASCSN